MQSYSMNKESNFLIIISSKDFFQLYRIGKKEKRKREI